MKKIRPSATGSLDRGATQDEFCGLDRDHRKVTLATSTGCAGYRSDRGVAARLETRQQRTSHLSGIATWPSGSRPPAYTWPPTRIRARRKLDEVVRLIAAAQQPDGYLNTHFTVVEPAKTMGQPARLHELYCGRHLIEAQWLMRKLPAGANCRHLVPLRRSHWPGVRAPARPETRVLRHPEIELALVRLFRFTGEERYLRLAQYFVEERGRQPHYYDVEARRAARNPNRSGQNLRLLFKPTNRARAVEWWATRARLLPLQRHGRRGRGDGRCGIVVGVPPAVGRSDQPQAVSDAAGLSLRAQRRIHRGLRLAE